MAFNTNESDSDRMKRLGIRMGIGGVIGAGIGTSLGTALLPGLGTAMGATVGTAIGTGVGTMIGAVVGTETGAGVRTTIGAGVGMIGAGIGTMTRLAHMLSEINYTPYKRHVNKQGWMPYGIQKVDVGPEGGTITLQSKANIRTNFKEEDVIQLVVPEDAVRKQGGGKLPIRYGVLLNGKFKLKDGYKLASPVVYVSYDPKDTTKPFELRLPHWASDEDVFIATAPLDDNEGGDVIKLNLKDGTISSSRNAAVSPVSGSKFYAVAVREGSKSNFYAIQHEIPIKDGRGVELSVIISYASSVWYEILREHYFPDGNFPYPCPVFKFLDSSIRPRLAKDKGPGWEAKLCGYNQIGQDHTAMEFHDIKDGDQLEKAVNYKRYPPRFVYKVIWSAKAEAYKQRRQVEVLIKGSNPELSFSCLTFEAPVPGPFNAHISSNPEEGSYSHVRAKHALQTFIWCELRRDIQDMLTKSRVYTLERQYKLIDSPCNATIKSDLEKGDTISAATTLIEYFEKNHNSDDLLRFCEFLRDEAVEAGGSAVLEGLADRIERAVKDLELQDDIERELLLLENL